MNRYNFIRELSRGAFGRAFLIQPKGNPNIQYVAKQIDISKANQQDIDSIKNEIQLLQQCNHPNVVKYIESFVDNNNQYIIMEYCDSGDLEKFLEQQKQKGPLSEDQILCFFTQICLALYHVHNKHILHRDMKTANLFLTKAPSKAFLGYQIKLGDFGVSKTLKGNQSLTQTFVGTPLYMAPEILQDKPYNSKTDIWSIGCILYNMCTFQQMIKANTMHTLMMQARNNRVPQITDQYSQKIQQLLDSTVQSDPKKRLSVQALLQLPQLQAWIPKLLTQEQLNAERFNLQSQMRLRPATASGGVQVVPGPAPTFLQQQQQIQRQQIPQQAPIQPQQPTQVEQKLAKTNGGLNYFTVGRNQAQNIPQAPTLPDFNITKGQPCPYPSNVAKQGYQLPTQTNSNTQQQAPALQATAIKEQPVLQGNPLYQSKNNTTQQFMNQSTYKIPQQAPVMQVNTQVPVLPQSNANQQYPERSVVEQNRRAQSSKRQYGPQITQNYGQAITNQYNQPNRSPSPSSTSDFFFQDETSNGFGRQLKEVVMNQVNMVIQRYGQQQYDAWKLEMKRNILFGQEIRNIPQEHVQLMMSVADFNML